MKKLHNNGWFQCTLGDLFKVKHGFAFDGKFFTSEGEYILLTPGNFYDEGGFKLKDKEKYFVGDIPKNYVLKKGQLIIAMTEQAEGLLGSSAIIPASNRFLHNQRLGLITDWNPNKTNTRFLYYLLNSRPVRAQIQASASGTKVRHTSPTRIGEVKVFVPPLPTQRKIASILSAYDDQIENNTRRIAILEEMAQRIYKEWFVNFRFPGHENAKFVDSPLGKIPDGWKVEKLKNVAEVNARSIKKGNEPDSINYIDIASVSTGSVDAVQAMSFSEAPGRARRIIRHGDIIWSTVRPNRKSYSLILNPLQNMIASTGFAVISGITAPHSYLYYALTTDGFVGYLVSNATGSAYPAVSSADFEKAAILIPSTNILQKFHEFVEPLLVSNYCFARKNTFLRTTRDLLLPKLISGQLDVEDLNIDTLEPLVDDQT